MIVACYQPETWLKKKNKPSAPLQESADLVFQKIREWLIFSQDYEAGIAEVTPLVFRLRYEFLAWLNRTDNATIQEISELQSERFAEEFPPHLAVFADSVRFGLRMLKKVLESQFGVETTEAVEGAAEIKPISFAQFSQSVLMAMPQKQAQEVIDFTFVSLKIETLIFALLLIDDENISIPQAKIRQLEFLAADSAQTYGAYARMLGILEKKRPNLLALPDAPDADFEKEDRALAEAGLDEFRKVWEK